MTNIRTTAFCYLRVGVCVLLFLLCSAGSIAFASELKDTAELDAKVADAALELDAAESRMAELEQSSRELEDSIDELKNSVDELATDLLEVQTQLLEHRGNLSLLAAYQYRHGSYGKSLLSLLCSAENFNDFISGFRYLSFLASYQSEQIAEQQKTTDEFKRLLDEVTELKDAESTKLKELEENISEAQDLLANAKENLTNATAEQAQRIAALEVQAEAMPSAKEVDSIEDAVMHEDVASATEQSTSDNSASEDTTLTDTSTDTPIDMPSSQDVASQSQSQTNDTQSPSADSQSAEEKSAEEETQDYIWQTGLASAYGGATDPSTGAVAYTATGDLCDDTTMGVAVPMAWENYRSYFGKTVLIKYGGMTVVAIINDCGYMAGGARSLDLQPGVWRAFGFSSCNAWGVRTVEYCIL